MDANDTLALINQLREILSAAESALINKSTSVSLAPESRVGLPSDILHSLSDSEKVDLLAKFTCHCREITLSEITRHTLKTNDIVTLHGGPGRSDTRSLSINGSGPIGLARREFLFLLVLFRHRKSHGQFLSMEKILNLLILLKEEELGAGFASFWIDPTPEDVFRIVRELRAKIAEAGHNAKLLENSHGAGYRLSTASCNVVVEYDGQDRGSLWLSDDSYS